MLNVLKCPTKIILIRKYLNKRLRITSRWHLMSFKGTEGLLLRTILGRASSCLPCSLLNHSFQDWHCLYISLSLLWVKGLNGGASFLLHPSTTTMQFPCWGFSEMIPTFWERKPENFQCFSAHCQLNPPAAAAQDCIVRGPHELRDGVF